jgi:hypothetical protein
VTSGLKSFLNVDCVFPPATDEEERDKTPTTCHTVYEVPTAYSDFVEYSQNGTSAGLAGSTMRTGCIESPVLAVWNAAAGVTNPFKIRTGLDSRSPYTCARKHSRSSACFCPS